MDFEKLQIKEHVRIIQKHRKIVLLCLASVLLPLTILLLLSKPQYQASIALAVSDNAIAHLLTNDIDISPNLTVANYMDILAGQGFASRVVRALSSDSLAPDWAKASSTVNARGDQSSPSPGLKNALGFTAETLGEQEEAVIELRKRMQIDHRGGNMIKVAIRADDPDEAYRITKTIGEEFKKLNLEAIQQRITALNGFYQDQLDRSYQRLLQAEENLAEFRRSHGITSENREIDRIAVRLDNLENQIIELSGQQKLVENRIAMLDNQLAQLAEKTPTKIKMDLLLPRLDELKRRLMAQENELMTQSAIYTDKHPRIQSLKRDIEGTIHELRSLGASAAPFDTSQVGDPMMVWYDLYIERLLTEIELNNLRTKKGGLETLADDYRSRLLAAMPEQGQELMKLQREVEVANDAYQAMLGTNEKIQRLEAEKAITVNVVEPAERPIEPLPRNRKFKMLMGLFIGLVLGFGLAYLKEALDRSVKTNEDIEKKLGLAVFGNVVDFSERNGGRKHRFFGAGSHKPGAATKSNLVLLEDPGSDAAENFRALRANIDLTLPEFQNRQIMMVTSPGSGEGKSTVALNLATSFTLYGKKTLLLDTDLYHPTTHLRLGIQPEVGLSNWLAEEIMPDTMRSKIILNGSALDFIPTGTGKVTFQKLAINSKMQSLLTDLREQYDVIIIDAPPVIPVSDPVLIVPYVDLVLMVLESGHTQLEAARQALKILKKAKSAHVGVVLNRIREQEEYGSSNYLKLYRRAHRTLPATASANAASRV